MKQHLTAIAFNEKELESYVSQLLSGGFETVSDVKKSEDGTFYQALAKTAKGEGQPSGSKTTALESENLSASA